MRGCVERAPESRGLEGLKVCTEKNNLGLRGGHRDVASEYCVRPITRHFRPRRVAQQLTLFNTMAISHFRYNWIGAI